VKGIPRSHLRFPLFDPLRGFAAISILVVHVAIFTDGFSDTWHGRIVSHLDIGVPFFFLLSAFLLYRPFVAARREHHDRPAFSGYAKRRFLRIAPAYWAVLIFAAIVPGLAGIFSGNWWVYFGLLQNYPVYTPDGTCAVDVYRCGLPQTWSLGVEVFFYALLPFYVLGMAWLVRRLKRRNWLTLELTAAGLLGAVSFVIQRHVSTNDFEQVLTYSPIGRGWWFGLGLGLAAVSVWVQERPSEPAFARFIARRPAIPLLAALLIYLWLCFDLLGPAPQAVFQLTDVSDYLISYIAFGVIALLVVLPATFGAERKDVLRRFLEHPVCTWLGLISYGIFLWQYPILIVALDAGVADWWPSMQFPVVVAVTLVGTIACAAVSYYSLERPLMRWGRRSFGSPTTSEKAATS
jgi:peptidoglycan/LPS O-acetylase OafA/YrhL